MLAFDQDYARGRASDCRLCTRPEFRDERRRWGCDEPTEAPWLLIDCFMCGGQPRVQPHCLACRGEGRLGLDRCESHYVGPRERFVVDAVVMLEAGVAPFPGELGEWPAPFVDAVHLVASERGRILREACRSD